MREATHGFGIAHELPRPAATCPSARRFSSTRAVRSAAHGATRRPRCRTSTSCSRPPGLCSPRRRALPRRAGWLATWPALRARRLALPRARATPIPGEAATGDHLQAVYHLWLVGHQLEHGARAVARPVHLPAGEPARASTSAAGRSGFRSGRSTRLRAGPRVEPVVLLTYLAAGGVRPPLAARARAAARARHSSAGSPSRSRRTASRRAPAICAGRSRCCCRSRSGRSSGRAAARAGGSSLRGGALAVDPVSGHLHLALGAVPFFLAYALCALAEPAAGRGALARRGGRRRRAARRPARRSRARSRRRPLARGGRALLRDRARFRHPPRRGTGSRASSSSAG